MSNAQLLIILSGMYALHLSLKFSGIQVPVWMSSYLADLLCMPVMFVLFTGFMRHVLKRADFKMSIWMILFSVGYVTLVFEWLAPMCSNRYTADAMDAVCYLIGGVFYKSFQSWERMPVLNLHK